MIKTRKIFLKHYYLVHGRDDREKYKKIGIYFPDDGKGLYEKLKGKKFKESLGIYYQEEIQGETGAPEANRTEKRVITYEEV